jgi:hypothetical protein
MLLLQDESIYLQQKASGVDDGSALLKDAQYSDQFSVVDRRAYIAAIAEHDRVVTNIDSDTASAIVKRSGELRAVKVSYLHCRRLKDLRNMPLWRFSGADDQHCQPPYSRDDRGAARVHRDAAHQQPRAPRRICWGDDAGAADSVRGCHRAPGQARAAPRGEHPGGGAASAQARRRGERRSREDDRVCVSSAEVLCYGVLAMLDCTLGCASRHRPAAASCRAFTRRSCRALRVPGTRCMH